MHCEHLGTAAETPQVVEEKEKMENGCDIPLGRKKCINLDAGKTALKACVHEGEMKYKITPSCFG